MLVLDPLLRLLARDKLSVFLFHKVPLKPHPLVPHDLDLLAFETVLDFLVERFRILPLGEAVVALGRGTLPRHAACITFDDGYPDWVGGIGPALQRRDAHATFFITSGQFEGRPLWHERIAHALYRTELETLEMHHPAFPSMSLELLSDRQRAVFKLEHDLKYLTVEARDELLDRLEAQAGVRREDVPRMSVSDLQTLHAKGFDIGAHTVDHPILACCGERRAMQEIGAVREQLEGMLRTPVTSFAYPNGRPFADFSSRHIAMVKRAGYTSAVTTQWGAASRKTSIYQIPRFTPWGPGPMRGIFQLGRNLLTPPDCLPEPELQ